MRSYRGPRTKLERLFERWLGLHRGDFQGRIYEALCVGGLLGFTVTGLLLAWTQTTPAAPGSPPGADGDHRRGAGGAGRHGRQRGWLYRRITRLETQMADSTPSSDMSPSIRASAPRM